MIPPVLISYATGGLRDVEKAFETIYKLIARFEKDIESSGVRGAAARTKAAETEAQKREKAYKRLTTELEKAEKRATRETETQSKAREKAAQRAMAAVGKEAVKAADKEIREAERAAREVERLEAYKLRVRIRSSEMAGAAAARAVEQEAAARKRAASAMGAGLAKTVGAVGGIASMGIGAMTIGGGFVLADAAKTQLAAQKQAAQLVNLATVGNGGVTPQGANIGSILGQATQLSTETGISKDQLIGASVKYAQNARNADFKGAMGNMGFFAKMATVTGTDIGDIAEAAGQLKTQNQSLDAKGMQQMLLDVYAQSGSGSMSMVDAAKQLGTMGSTRAFFTQDEGKSQRSLFGIGQIARAGGDVGEAGTFTKDIAAEVGVANRKFRKAHGRDLVKVDSHGMMSSPEQMVEDVFRGTKGNQAEIGELFGKRGATLFHELGKSYLTGEKTGGVEGGVKAAMANLGQVTSATMTPEQLDKMHADTLSTPAARLHMAFEKLEATTGEKLEPLLERLADKAPELAEKFAKIVDAGAGLAEWFLDNPLKGVGAVVGLSMGKEIAAAQIPKLLERAMTTKLGSGLAIAGASIAIAEAGMMVIDQLASMDVRKQQEVIKDTNEAANLAGKLRNEARSGNVSASDIASANASAKDIAAQKAAVDAQIKKDQALVDSPTTPALGKRIAQDEINKLSGQSKQFGQALDMLKAAVQASTEAMKALADAARSKNMHERTDTGS